MIDFGMMILQGKTPILVKTKDPSRPWYVEAEDGAIAPNLEQRVAMWKQLADRGWGQPVQQVVIDAQVLQHSTSLVATLPTGQLTPGQVFELGRVLGLQAGTPPTSASVIDAECVEAPASASADDASSSDDDDDQDLEQPAPITASDHHARSPAPITASEDDGE